MESSDNSFQTVSFSFDNSSYQNSDIVPAAEHYEPNVDERKRKQNNPISGANKKGKIENSSSLGLSLLQTYDEDIQDDYEETNDVIADDKNSKISLPGELARESNVKIKKNISITSVVDKDLSCSSDYCAVNTVFSLSKKDVVDVTFDNTKTPSLKIELVNKIEEEHVIKSHLQNPLVVDTSKINAEEKNVRKSINYDEPSSLKSYSIEKTSANKYETTESVNSDYYKTGSATDDAYVKSEFTGEKSGSRPVKKVKLNRSKFFKPADESSNDDKSSLITDPSNDCKSSSTTDFNNECKLTSTCNVAFKSIITDKKQNYSDSASSDSAASNDVSDILENVDSDCRTIFNSSRKNDESFASGTCKELARFHVVDESINTVSNKEDATSSLHSIESSQIHHSTETNNEIKSASDVSAFENYCEIKTTLEEDNIPLAINNNNLSDRDSQKMSEPVTASKILPNNEEEAILLEGLRDIKQDNNDHEKPQLLANIRSEGDSVANEFSLSIAAPTQDSKELKEHKETPGNGAREYVSSVLSHGKMKEQKTCEKTLQKELIGTVEDNSDDMANDEKLTFEDPIEARNNGSSDEEIFRDAMETVESENEEKRINDSNMESSSETANEYESNSDVENVIPTSTRRISENKTKKVDQSMMMEKFECSTEQSLETVDKKCEQILVKFEKVSKPEQILEKLEKPLKFEKALEKVGESATLEQPSKKVEEPLKFEQILEKVEEFSKVDHTSEKIDEPSKLEQALTGRIESSHCSTVKKENVAGTAREKRTTNVTADEAARYVVNMTETIGSKENIKLHISLQGNRASIKKAKEIESSSVTHAASSSEIKTPAAEQPPPRIKRKYTKRAKVIIPEMTDSDEKTYKLRTRNARKQNETSAATMKKASKELVSSLNESSCFDKFTSPKIIDNKISISPITIAIDRLPESNAQSSGGGKVPAIKLKISKSSGMTATEITSKPVAVTQEKLETRVDECMSPTGNQIVQFLEQVRKVDAKNTDQGSCAWSGKDLQRVERLLKESNVTITPVTCSSSWDPLRSSSILKPILTEAKSRLTSKMSSSTVSPVSTTMSPVSTLITHSMIPTSTSREDIVATTEWPTSSETLNSKSVTETKTRNFNVILKPLDLEDKIRHWKVEKSNCDQISISDDVEFGKLDANGAAVVDVKTEIRRKIASAERRKQENGFDSINLLDAKGPSTKSSSGGKTLPDLLPIGNSFSSENSICRVTPTDVKSVTQIGESETIDNTDTKFLELNTSPVMYPVLSPAVFPKKRGRPTKAMVAARNAYRQNQEALENLKRQNLQAQELSDNSNLSPHFLIPLVDGSSGERMNQTSGSPQNPSKNKRGRKPKDRFETSSNSDYSANDGSVIQSTILDPEREMEDLKRLEEERIRKEQERERKNELRRQKARERSDLVKAKRLRQKMKAEERQKRMQEQKRLLQEEKKKLEEEIKKLPATVSGFDTAGINNEECIQLPNSSFNIGVDEDFSSTTTELNHRVKKSRMEVIDSENNDLTVDQIAEYQWPIQGGELYMIQEQISKFLGVKSFKRKYPDIKRRPVDSEERAYLVDSGLVSETLCDLGITAVCCAEVLDIMCSDFPEKYEELRKYMREKQMKEMTFKQKAWANGLGYKLLMADGSKQDLKKRAMESASNWNSALNRSRGEDRRCAMDLQTFIIHYPKNKVHKMTIPTLKIGSYPISILPGQFSDFYKEYTSTELRYMPLNTVLYGPLKHPEAVNGVDGSQTDSDDSSSSDESSSTTSESTQAAEETVEDIEQDVSISTAFDGLTTSQPAEKLEDVVDVSSKDEEEITRREMLNKMRETLTAADDDDSLKGLCKVCLGDCGRNRENVPEVLIRCSQCSSLSHPTCLDLSLNMVPHIQSYKWQCPECKSCARCKENADEDKMLFCDNCDRGYHIYCVGLKKVPSGSWQCQECITVDISVSNNIVMISRSGLFRDPISVKEET